jgi:Ca2+-binding RTX toxin-like protein
MSFLRRGKSRRAKSSRALVTVFALVGFQALAIVGAGSALAVTDCTFNPATGGIQCTIDPGEGLELAVETTAADLDPLAPAGAILQRVNGGAWEAIGSASNTNTTSVTVLGSNGSNEFFGVDNNVAAANTSGEFNTAITWAIDLGTGTSDFFQINAGEGDDEVVVADGTWTVNGGGGTILGMEFVQVFGNDGDDTIDGSALTTNVVIFAFGNAGDDWIAPGAAGTLPAANGPDFADGGVGTDQLSYGTRTTATVIDNTNSTSGHDANGDGDVLDVGDELDVQINFEVKETGSGADTLVGVAGVDETFIPGDGDDDITGNGAGDDDLLDYSSSSALVTIDPDAGTVTGQGTDTFTGITQFVGSDFDDVLLWDGTTTLFEGGAGTDLVDASTSTTGQFIDLDTLDGLPLATDPDSTENAIGGSANDTLLGNDLRNNLDGGDGDDTLSGFAGNDTLLGRAGNDTYSGGTGADKVSFRFSPNGVEVDASAGFASGEGDDSLGGDIEIFIGSNHNDNMTGGGGAVAVNFRFVGRGGKDILTGSGSNDTLKGGRANDILRGAAGDDTLLGGPGKRDRGFGGSGVDVCRGTEREKGCEV